MEEKYLYVIIVLLIVGLIVLYFYDNNDKQNKISKIDDLENQLALCNVKPPSKMARSSNGASCQPWQSYGGSCVSDYQKCYQNNCDSLCKNNGDGTDCVNCTIGCNTAYCSYKCNVNPNDPNADLSKWVGCMGGQPTCE